MLQPVVSAATVASFPIERSSSRRQHTWTGPVGTAAAGAYLARHGGRYRTPTTATPTLVYKKSVPWADLTVCSGMQTLLTVHAECAVQLVIKTWRLRRRRLAAGSMYVCRVMDWLTDGTGFAWGRCWVLTGQWSVQTPFRPATPWRRGMTWPIFSCVTCVWSMPAWWVLVNWGGVMIIKWRPLSHRHRLNGPSLYAHILPYW